MIERNDLTHDTKSTLDELTQVTVSMNGDNSSLSDVPPWLYFLAGALLPTIAYYWMLRPDRTTRNDDDSQDEEDAMGIPTDGASSTWGYQHAPYKMVFLVNQGRLVSSFSIFNYCLSSSHVSCFLPTLSYPAGHVCVSSSPSSFRTQNGQGENRGPMLPCRSGLLQKGPKAMPDRLGRLGANRVCQDCHQMPHTTGNARYCRNSSFKRYSTLSGRRRWENSGMYTPAFVCMFLGHT